MSTETTLTPRQRDDLRIVAGMMIPPSEQYAVPGADDAAIQADIMATPRRDTGGAPAAPLIRAVLQCYYRDDRVLRSLGLELRPPFPIGYPLEQGDWSLLDPVKARPSLLRRT